MPVEAPSQTPVDFQPAVNSAPAKKDAFAMEESVQSSVAETAVAMPSPGRKAQPEPASVVEQPAYTAPATQKPVQAAPAYAPVEQPQFTPQATAVPAQASAPMDDHALSAFLQGFGINPEMVPSENQAQWWYTVGHSMQLLMNGLMDTLHNRASFKQSNRLNHTAFQRQENNPLKFSANLEDAIHNLFNRASVSFLSPERAISEAFDDIEKHENAMMNGVEGAVHGMMKLLHPDNTLTPMEASGLLNKMNPSRIKAKQWEIYQKRYFELENEMTSTNKPFYLEDFVKAYEQSLKQ
nr:type VI secretion system-associated FHA domain protein TagH [Thaumasiovibrio subtropicus]